jgi:hypothetical protein
MAFSLPQPVLAALPSVIGGPSATFDSFTISNIDLLQKYLDEQKPKEQPDKLRDILDNFFENLTKHFVVADLILKVGAQRELRALSES